MGASAHGALGNLVHEPYPEICGLSISWMALRGVLEVFSGVRRIASCILWNWTRNPSAGTRAPPTGRGGGGVMKVDQVYRLV